MNDRVSDLITEWSNARREGTAVTVELGPFPSQYYLYTAPWSAPVRAVFVRFAKPKHPSS